MDERGLVAVTRASPALVRSRQYPNGQRHRDVAYSGCEGRRGTLRPSLAGRGLR